MDCVLTESCNKAKHYILIMPSKLLHSVVQYGQGGFVNLPVICITAVAFTILRLSLWIH